jgi:hypothetical protein
MTTLSSRAKDTKIDISTNDDLNTHAREQKPLVLSWETIKTIIYIIGNVGRYDDVYKPHKIAL